MLDEKINSTGIISTSRGSSLEIVTSNSNPRIEINYSKERGQERKEESVSINEFISVKGIKAQGNRLSTKKILKLNLVESPEDELEAENELKMNVEETVVDTVDDSAQEDVVLDDKNDEMLSTNDNSDDKIIIDSEDSQNQFKLDL